MRVIIIGGGVTGLAAAWELEQRGVHYTLLEASGRIGGKLITEHKDGFIIEAGADSFLTTKPSALDLCDEIGFTDQLVPTNTQQRAVYLYRNGTLYPFPKGMRLIVPTDADAFRATSPMLSDAGRERMLDEIDIPPRTDTHDESLAAFVRRRFGDEALEVFGGSLLSGIHVGDPDELSIAATFPDYPKMEREHGSLIRALQTQPSAAPRFKAAFVSPRHGMSTFPAAIAARLTGDVRLNASVAVIHPNRSIQLKSGERLHADGVILTTPTRTAASIIASISPELNMQLSLMKANSSATVTLGYRAADLNHPLDGYGFVIPRTEPTHITACTWSSTKLPGRAPDGYALLRVFVGGSGARERDLDLTDPQLIELARRELHTIMGIDAAPVITRVARWKNASPQYAIGHGERVAQLRALCPDWLVLAGAAYDGVGVPDCVRQGRAAARELAARL
jgi:protoporphyrinogen/coproporphyrinogen III oxidase